MSDSGKEPAERKVFNRRAALIGIGQALAFGALGSRLYQIQVLDAGRYALLADDNRFNAIPLAPTRGNILDRFGVALATNEETFRVSIVPALAGNLEHALDRLAKVVSIAGEERARIIARARRQPANLPILVTDDLGWDQVATINLHAPDLPGIETGTLSRRNYFHVPAMGHIIGHVGAVERFAMGDDPVLRVPGMRIGRAGIERGSDRVLRGESGLLRREVDARGRIVRNLARIEPLPGGDIVTTIDVELQAWLVGRLSTERRAAVVAMDVHGGEVVAMASAPGYDPALNIPQPSPPTQPPSESRRGRRRARSLRTGHVIRRQKADALFNRSTSGLYPPGSTFKIVTALAALEAGIVDLRERIDCQGSFTFADKTYRCWNRGGHGRCDLHRAMRESCDVYFYEVARRMGIETLAAMGRRLGLGQVFEAGISPLAPGVVPTPAWKRGRFGRPWFGGETILTGIGQGYVLTSPLQLAVMTARAATGLAVTPTLVRPELGRQRPQFARLGLADRNLQAVQKALRAVVNEAGGTGSRASLWDLGVEVAGKTGTSQVSRRSANRYQASLPWEERDHALFVGYFPADAPRYAVAAVIEHGGSGGNVAAPLVREVMAELVARDPMKKPAVAAPAPERRRGPAADLAAPGRETPA
jgi:penicillin-binding protein 2